jgi:hypothetical protein
VTDFILNVYQSASYITSALIIIIGSLVILALFLFPIWFLVNNVIYRRIKATSYVLSYLAYRKEFDKWYRSNRPDVYDGEVKNKNF